MQSWTVEYGTFWVAEAGQRTPPTCPARVEVAFAEAGRAETADLAAAMHLPTPEPIEQRLNSGRRCFTLKADGQIVAYGWVSRGVEDVGELERQFHLRDDEAYIWDCGTVEAWRGQRCYSALLSQIAERLHGEGVLAVWIGASRLNQPSVRGIANAGFQHVVDITYRRVYRLTLMWLHQAPAPQRPQVAAAYRILVADHERRFGQLAVGYRGWTR
jgi:GNAT superfamily N-acetyltransferase